MFKKSKVLLSVLLAVVMLLGVIPSRMAFAAEETFTIFHVNDMHGRVMENERNGELGFAKLTTYVDNARKKGSVLFLDAGDTLHGTTEVNVTQGEAIVSILNEMGIDAMVPGNHDFNYGYKRLLELKEMAKYPMIAANVKKESDNSSDFDAYIIKELPNGIKVGIFGLGTDETKYKSHPKNTEGIAFTDIVKEANAAVKELQAKGVNMIVALVHLGIDASSQSTSTKLANEVKGIDLIIDGHSHSQLETGKNVNGTLIVQTGSYLHNIGEVKVTLKDGKVSNKEAKLVHYADLKDLAEAPRVLEKIKKLEELNKPILSQVVGLTDIELDGVREHVRAGETNLGNLITDAMRESTGADFALTNGGGIRASIDKGEITLGEILTAFPFTNTLAVINVTGEEVIKALEHGVNSYPDAAGHFPHVSGLTYVFDPSKEVGQRILHVRINGEPLVRTKTYKMVTNDFLAAGGDGYEMFKGKPFVGEGGLLSDVLSEYIASTYAIKPMVEKRIVASKDGLVPVTPAEPTTPIKPVPSGSYKVVKGDNLYRIGLKFGTTWQELAKINNLANPHLIFPDQVIVLSR